MPLHDMLKTLRKTLHSCPEVAGDEVRTANVISSFLRLHKPKLIIPNLGGWGVAAVFEGERNDLTVMVRCELDALPLRDERTTIPTPFSRNAHLCGHDGHMVMTAGLAAMYFSEKPPCRVVLLFQPAEETGEGAARVIADPRFAQIKPDFAIGLHNLPGFPLSSVVLRRGTFACSSVGLRIVLNGHPSHAAEPENALSPMHCLCALPTKLEKLANTGKPEPRRLLTITHMSLGQPSFGVTPGNGVMLATMRSESGEDLELLRTEAESLAANEARCDGIEFELDWHDHFPETRSDERLVDLLKTCCGELGVQAIESERPFRWSEDFGHFNRVCPCLFFGLGAGEEAAGLHQNDYQFPDEIIPTGVSVYHQLIQRIARAFLTQA